MFDDVTKELKKLFLIKNKEYGNGYFSGEYSDTERWMSIKRKVTRLENFYKNNQLESISETLDDTWRDLAIYCIMELMYRRKNGTESKPC